MAVCGRNCPNDAAFEQKYGALDYFKQSESGGVVAAVRAMEDYPVQKPPSQFTKSGDVVGSASLVEGFITYLWEEIVLDVKFRKGALQPAQNSY